MFKIKSVSMFVCLLFVSIFFMSATPAGKENTQPQVQTATTITAEQLQDAIDKNKVGKLIEETTGEKLTLKEKIALKIFNKKIKTISKNENTKAEGKTQLIAGILCWLLGVLGVHRFYLGYTMQGILQILTLGGCGIWTLIDLIRIIMGTLKPKGGEYVKS